MAGTIPLFEKDAEGLLHQIHPAEVNNRRAAAAGYVSQRSIVVEVLLTPQEISEILAEAEGRKIKEEARSAEAQAVIDAAVAQLKEEADAKAARRAAVTAKLTALGLSEDDVQTLME